MAAAQAVRAGAAYIELFVKDNRLTKGLQAASQKLKAFGAGITSIGAQMVRLGAGAVAGFLGAAKVFADMGSALVDMSQRTGVSVEALSELGFAAEQSGADLETLETGLRKMQKLIVDAAGGSKEARKALAQLGLTVDDLARLSPDEQFKVIADRLSQIRNPTLRAATALDVFGKSGTRLLPLISGGAKGIEELEDQARALGLTMSTEEAQAAESFGDSLDLLWKMLKRAAFAVGAALLPTLSDLVVSIVQTVKTVTDWIKDNQDLVATIFQVAAAVLAGGLALVALGGIISFFGAAIGGLVAVISGIGTVVSILGTILGALLSPIGLVIVGVGALAAVLLTSTDAGAQALTWLGKQFATLRDTALAAWQGIADALAAGDIALAAKILWLALKMEWRRGVLFLEEHWLAFKGFFVETFHEAVFAVARSMNDAWAGLETAWVETVTFLANAWTSFIGVLQKSWNRFGGFFQKVWAKVKGSFSGMNAEAEISRINEEVARQEQEIEARKNAQLQAREQQRQQRRGDIEQRRAGAAKELDRMQADERADRQGRDKAALAESAKALADARKEFQAAVAEAARKRAEKDAARAMPARRPELEGLDELVVATQQKIEVQGTFNPLAVSGLGGEGLAERTARATEQVATNTRKLLQKAQDGGLVFV